jgi:hypothetical protein
MDVKDKHAGREREVFISSSHFLLDPPAFILFLVDH